MKNKIRKWRVNYIVEYAEKEDIRLLKPVVHSFLGYLSMLKGIDYEMEPDRLYMYESVSSSHTEMKGIVVDLLYFRSSGRSEMSSRDFRRLLDLVFLEYRQGFLNNKPFEAYAQLYKSLKDYPFPNKAV